MLGIKLLWRQWKAGDLGILLLSTFLAVAIVTGLGLFTNRLSGAIKTQSNKLLGADLVMEANAPFDLDSIALPADITTSLATEFRSMLSIEEQFQLCDVWAVDDAYPLKGELKVSNEPYGDTTPITNGPAPGEIWPDSRVLLTLGVELGDDVEIGETKLRISKVLVSTPGEGSNALAPLVLINNTDLKSTGIIQEGSNVDFSYYFAGPETAISDLQSQLRASAPLGTRVYTVSEGQPRVARAISRAEKYMLLGATLGVILAGAAIAIASRRYALEQEQMVAVLKTLGLKSRDIAKLYIIQLSTIAVIAIGFGWLAGGLLDRVISEYIERALNMTLVPGGLGALWRGGITGVFCLLVFALPPLWNLRGVLPIKVLRREVGQSALRLSQVAAIGVFGLFVLVAFFTKDLAMTLALFSGLLLVTVLIGTVAFVILRSTRAVGMHAGNSWRLAAVSLQRRALENAFQVVIFTTTLMLFLVLLNMRTTLIDGWQTQIPEGTPNYFLVNISKDEVPEVQDWLRSKDVQDEGLYPIVRTRLTHINNLTLRERAEQTGTRARRNSRGVRLTYAAEVPSDNKLIEGQWWVDQSEAVLSIESGYAERLDASIGDVMRFDSGGNVFEAQIKNIREVDWEQMRPNFFLITNENVLENMPAEFITSFHVPDERKELIPQLMRRHPTTQLFAIDAVIKQVRSIIKQVSTAIELVLWLTVACGALVLVATIRASQYERMQESAMLRTLGAPGKFILRALTIEFVLIGIMAGVLAALGAEITSWLIQTKVFEMEEFSLSAIVWWLGPLLGAVLIGGLGMLACRRVVTQSPVSIFRELAS